MPIILRGDVATLVPEGQLADPAPAVRVAPSQERTTQPAQNKTINNGQQFDPNKTYLVVNGKVKEISNKSKYLLDMLIIEEGN